MHRLLLCGVLALSVAAGANAATVLFADKTIEVAKTLDDAKDLWVSPEDLTRINGFVLKPEGACLAEVCIPIPKGKEAYGGLVGWYRKHGDQLETVMIRFDNLDGIPVKLIDKLFAEYPGFGRETDFQGESWVADDVRKWVQLVRLYESDRTLMQMALGRVTA